MFDNKQVVSEAIQSDLTVDTIAYSTISTISTTSRGAIYTCIFCRASDISTEIREAIYIFRRATDIFTTIREAIYACIFRRATDIFTTILEAIYIFRRAIDISTIREAIDIFRKVTDDIQNDIIRWVAIPQYSSISVCGCGCGRIPRYQYLSIAVLQYYQCWCKKIKRNRRSSQNMKY